MRVVVLASLVMSAGLVLSARGVQSSTASASAILAEARQALGGEARLSAVRTFRLAGRIVQTYSQSSTYGTFEFVAALPDKFAETQSMRSAGSANGASMDSGSINPMSSTSVGFSGGLGQNSRIGFNGRRAIFEPGFPDSSSNLSVRNALPLAPERIANARVAAQSDFVEITLGLFAASFQGAPVTFADVPAAAGRSVRVAGSRSGVLRFDARTHLPAGFDGLEYLDYRDVGGFQVPHRIRMAGTEWQMQKIEYDAPLPAGAFRGAQ